MPIFRRPSLDDRRRLVIYSQRLNEETVGGVAAQTGAARDAKRNQAAYGSRVQRRLRARWYGLVPVKSRTLVGLAVVLLSVAGVLSLLHWASLWWAPIAAHPEIARPLRLDRPDSLGTWFSAVLMVVTAGASFLVYQLRRYKSDDYHGHYRIWRVAIVLSLVCSVDCVTGLISWLGGVVDVLLAERDFLAGADWVRLLLGFGGAAFALRMIGEVARNRAAAMVLAGSFVCFALPLAMRWKFIQAEPATATLFVPIVGTLGRVGVMLAVVIYLRMLYREVRRFESGERMVQRLRQFFAANRIFAAKNSVSEDEGESSQGRGRRKPKASGTSDASAGRQRKPSESASVNAGANRRVRGRGESAEQEVMKDSPAGTKNTDIGTENTEIDKKEKVSFWKRFGRAKEAPEQDKDQPEEVKSKEVKSEKTSSPETAAEKKPRLFARFRSQPKEPSEKPVASEKPVKHEETKQPAKVDRIDNVNKIDNANKVVKSNESAESQDSPKKVGWFGRFGKSKVAAGTGGEDAGQKDDRKAEVSSESKGTDDRRTPVNNGSGSGNVAKPNVGVAQPTTSSRGQSAPRNPSDVQAGATTRPAPPAASNSVKRVPESSQADDDDDDDGQDFGDEEDVDPDSIDWASLSKSERRRMRKVLKRQGKAA